MTRYDDTIVAMNTGIKHHKVEEHGPAFTLRLVWKRGNHKETTMAISVDLCRSLKLTGVLNNLLPRGNVICPAYLDFARKIGSILLLPREGFHFKVTFTETELMCPSNMSEHHRKCYKILKFITNGDPFPYEKRNKLVDRMFYRFTDCYSFVCVENNSLGPPFCTKVLWRERLGVLYHSNVGKTASLTVWRFSTSGS